MSSHFANLDTSPRLQACLKAIKSFGSKGCTTLQIFELTRSMAVHTDVNELRKNGLTIECKPDGKRNGRRHFRYTLIEPLENLKQGEIL